ncbi:uncharacterized protein [Onthophagus taurus]|uniref:uncharacterized protein isoform X1 n=1 Tax=Onthophagus taurus TaxID=166361 RepID=UPI000C201C5D|nr:uncharacterized protein LOC111415809 isoform X1 [Onthophagus taurus]XP_022903456.1 uncharacterized protein LOC111415809 isoform X2 [Onthophagus taurus]
MSVSDPLIKDLKGCILNFFEEIKENGINDSNPDLLVFCSTTEKIFSTGLNQIHNTLGFIKSINNPWLWLDKIASDKAISFTYLNCVEKVRKCKSIQTNLGRLRLLIRLCLSQKCLHIPLEYLITSKKLNVYYNENCIIGDEILSEILLSVFRQVSKIPFHLNVNNNSFLDTSWNMPEVLHVEFVPCDTLGMTVSFSGDKAVIMSIKSNSVASENGNIEIGDILESLNGCLITSSTKNRLRHIFKSAKGRPVTLTIIKAVRGDLKQIYGPILTVLKDVRLDPDILRSRLSECTDSNDNLRRKYTGSGLRVTYMGYVVVGSKGDVKQIDKAVSSVFNPSMNNEATKYFKTRKDVCFELGELGVKCIDLATSEIVTKHSYMEISSCGSVASLPNYFAYIAGDDYCNTAKIFTCYIFFGRSNEMVMTILQSIGQGFHRTHFAV